jgi:hypothetical protein
MWRERVSYILRSSLAFVSMEGGRNNVKRAEGAVFASTKDRRPRVKIVEAAQYVIMGNGREGAKCVEAVDSVFTTRTSTSVANANG